MNPARAGLLDTAILEDVATRRHSGKAEPEDAGRELRALASLRRQQEAQLAEAEEAATATAEPEPLRRPVPPPEPFR